MLLLYLVQHFQSVPFPLAQSDSLRLHGALGHPWKRTFLLCTNRTFSFCGDRNLRKSFQAACVKVGLGVKTGPEDWQYKGRLIHDFRRSGGRKFLRARVPRRIAMKISGHLTESTFERYNIVDSTDLHEAMAKVEKYFDGNLMEVEENQRQDRQQLLSFQQSRGSSVGRAADS